MLVESRFSIPERDSRGVYAHVSRNSVWNVTQQGKLGRTYYESLQFHTTIGNLILACHVDLRLPADRSGPQ